MLDCLWYHISNFFSPKSSWIPTLNNSQLNTIRDIWNQSCMSSKRLYPRAISIYKESWIWTHGYLSTSWLYVRYNDLSRACNKIDNIQFPSGFKHIRSIHIVWLVRIFEWYCYRQYWLSTIVQQMAVNLQFSEWENNVQWWYFLCWCNVLRWIWCLWCYSECKSTPGKLEKYAWPRWESNLQIEWRSLILLLLQC
jgi:hypothetical protein